MLVFMLGLVLVVCVYFKIYVIDWKEVQKLSFDRKHLGHGLDMDTDVQMRTRRHSEQRRGKGIGLDLNSRNKTPMTHKHHGINMMIGTKQVTTAKVHQKLIEIICILAYLFVSVSANIGYVSVKDNVDSSAMFVLQIVLIMINGSLQVICPYLVAFVYHSGNLKQHSEESVLATAGLVSFVDVAVPIIASIFGDNLCIHQMLGPLPPIQYSYSYTSCQISYDSCVEAVCKCKYASSSRKFVTFTPEYIYGGQCRNAVLSSYIPVIILTNAYYAFGKPLLYFFITHWVQDLEEEFSLWGYSIKMEDYVLEDICFEIVKIWGCVSQMLTFGTIAPLATIAITVSITSQSYFLCCKIKRFYHLQLLMAGTNEIKNVPRNVDHIDVKCKLAHESIYGVVWPGLGISSVIMSLFCYDMAADSSTNSTDYAASLTLLVLTVVSYPVCLGVFFEVKKWYEVKFENKNQKSFIMEEPLTEEQPRAVIKNPLLSQPSLSSLSSAATATSNSPLASASVGEINRKIGNRKAKVDDVEMVETSGKMEAHQHSGEKNKI